MVIMKFERYAIYFTPQPDSQLAQFGASWLGWDLQQGAVAHLDLRDFDVAALTKRPRKYGFHGTMKAPFYLADGQSEAALLAAVQAFAAQQKTFDAGAMQVKEMGRFLHLAPRAYCADLHQLANACVERFEPFRAALSPEDMARRSRARLSENQQRMLKRWGYPFVMDAFRFHLTLTQRLPNEMAAPLKRAMDEKFGHIFAMPMIVDAISLCGQDQDGMFHLIERAAFSR